MARIFYIQNVGVTLLIASLKTEGSLKLDMSYITEPLYMHKHWSLQFRTPPFKKSILFKTVNQ